MQVLDIPTDVSAVLREFYVCEATTVNRQGQPISWPCAAYYDEASGQIVLTVSIGFPVKAFNARRHPQVSLLYSDPTGTTLEQPPTVLVQGDATVAETLDYFDRQLLGWFRVFSRRAPSNRRFISNRFVRWLFTWYIFQRLTITVQPRRMLVWSRGDFSAAPTEIEVSHVE